jgi:serine/threonine-protein kinase
LPLEVVQKELKAGVRIASQYVLERELGAGGMGVVWAADKIADGTKVALKFLRSDRPLSERVCQRFLQEARATRGIDHPGVVQIHDVVEDGGLPVLVMDLLVGETLASRLEQKGPMKAEDAIALLLPAAEALAAAHDRRIIHRDLKPENLFLCTRDGSEPDGTSAATGGSADVLAARRPSPQRGQHEEVRVLDFGIAKVMRDDGDGVRSGVMTSTGVVMGTPFYMAPEQLFSEGNIDERADVWAFGVILYECIAGRRPFSGPSVGQVLRLIALDAYTPLSQAAENGPPEAVCDLVARLLARERSQRPRTMRDVERLLRQVLDGSYECISPFAETLRLDGPTLQVAADVVRPASSGDEGAVSASSAGVRTDASLRTRRTRTVWLTGAGLVVAAASIGAVRLLAVAPADTAASIRAGAEARAPSTAEQPAAPGPTAHLVAPLASLALPSAAPATADSARAVVDAPQSQTSQTKPVAARLPVQHTIAKVDASAPVPSAAASSEPVRRPGSVVDVPPF